MSDGVEVGILMEQLDVFFDAKGSDEAIDGLPDRKASPSTGAIDLGGVFKCRQPLYPQVGIEQEEFSRLLKCRIFPDPLQDLAESQKMRSVSANDRPAVMSCCRWRSSDVPAPLKKSIQTVVSTTITHATSASPQDLLPTVAARGA